jgi:hypothetical protein
MGAEERENFGEFVMAICITLQGGRGDADAYQRRCEILATCSSTYSPVRTSQEAHSISIK